MNNLLCSTRYFGYEQSELHSLVRKEYVRYRECNAIEHIDRLYSFSKFERRLAWEQVSGAELAWIFGIVTRQSGVWSLTKRRRQAFDGVLTGE